MPIISVREMKIIDEKERQKQKKKQQKKVRKEQGGTEGILKGWTLNDFVVHLN